MRVSQTEETFDDETAETEYSRHGLSEHLRQKLEELDGRQATRSVEQTPTSISPKNLMRLTELVLDSSRRRFTMPGDFGRV